MVERPIPQDILKYKQKAIANFSAREVVFGGIGIFIILIGYFVVFKDIEDFQKKALFSGILASPAFIFGFVRIYGVAFEKIFLAVVLDNVVSPAKRYKQIHEPELEQFEQTRSWIRDKNIKDPKKIKKMMKVKPSSKYKAIK